MRAARSPDRTQTTAGALLIGAPIAPTHHGRGANQTADRARDRFGVSLPPLSSERVPQNVQPAQPGVVSLYAGWWNGKLPGGGETGADVLDPPVEAYGVFGRVDEAVMGVESRGLVVDGVNDHQPAAAASPAATALRRASANRSPT